jgi:hypothetical protein
MLVFVQCTDTPICLAKLVGRATCLFDSMTPIGHSNSVVLVDVLSEWLSILLCSCAVVAGKNVLALPFFQARCNEARELRLLQIFMLFMSFHIKPTDVAFNS